MQVRDTDALIVVDVQNDFCAGGALEVADADTIVPIINRVARRFKHVVLTRDWHPANHVSFSDNPQFVDGSWPAHCVQHSHGASFHNDLAIPDNAEIVSKATQPDREAYSDFDNTGLDLTLREKGVTRIFVCGLATDYCVKATALDGVRCGFNTVLIEDACRGVDNPKGTVDQALRAMREAGVTMAVSGDLR